MTTRLLPPEEWARLAGTETASATLLDPRDCQIVVVEDDEHAIIGSWALYRVWHAEGIWMAPAHRTRSAVLRRLIVAMRQAAQAVGALVVWTASKSEAVGVMALHAGAAVVPGTHYVLPVNPASGVNDGD